MRAIQCCAFGVGNAGDADRLDQRPAKPCSNYGDPLGRFLAMQLKEVGGDLGADRLQHFVVRIDDQGDALGPAPRRRCQKCGFGGEQVTWARRKKDESDEV